jgi:diguanylate cyclase (GGDEF)-like protein
MPEVTKPDLAARLEALRQEYILQLPQRLLAIEELWAGLMNGAGWSSAPARELHRLTHNLTGSGKTFGFAEVSEVARELEQLLKAAVAEPHPPGVEARSRMQTALGRLRAVILTVKDVTAMPVAAGAQPASTPSGLATRRLFLVEADAGITSRLVMQLGHYGYQLRDFARIDGVEEAVAREHPAAVLINIQLPDDDGAALASRLRNGPTPPPVVLLSAHGDIEARLKAVRAGAAAFFTQPVEIGELVDRLDTLIDPHPGEPLRILIVDDSVSLAGFYTLVLEGAGMLVETVQDPLQVLPVLARFGPDLILMDVYMPQCSGLELAAIIRQQGEYVSVPLVFLSTETDVGRQLAALGLGADDFLTKPIEPEYLLRAITTRAGRARTLRSLMLRDSLTGVLNHTAISARLEDEMARVERSGLPLAFAVIDLDHFKSVNDTHGHLVGDQILRSMTRLLRQRLRKSDIVGRMGGEEFAVIIPDTSLEAAYQVIETLRSSFARMRHEVARGAFSVTFSAGIAMHVAGRSVADLIGSADEAMYRAKQSGRNRVVIAS